jgi:hypothetical protein
MKFTAKSLIALFVTSSALLLTCMRSDAQVNIKILTRLAENCRNSVGSETYYQQILLNYDNPTIKDVEKCIAFSYHHLFVLSRFPWLNSQGEILPGYRSSIVVARLVEQYNINNYHYVGNPQLLDCLVSQNASSKECSKVRDWIGNGKVRDVFKGGHYYSRLDYLVYICPTCVVAHDEASGSGELILKAFMEWFMKLDKSQRREVISLLGDDNKSHQLRALINEESKAAVKQYRETRARVQQQEQERRRQELLGN